MSLFAAVVVYADEIQGWVPEAIILPDDAEVVMNREIGSSIRMFSFSTHADVRTLFRDWSAALEESQYSVRPQQSEFDEAAIEFSGEDILNAKIAAGVINGDEPVVITFDATLK
ncbi:hypothetical protein J2X53_004446 [Pseudorhodobacter sp. 4114]|nr:hypothetical protein [Pseudorhodobacter sp. 4114]